LRKSDTFNATALEVEVKIYSKGSLLFVFNSKNIFSILKSAIHILKIYHDAKKFHINYFYSLNLFSEETIEKDSPFYKISFLNRFINFNGTISSLNKEDPIFVFAEQFFLKKTKKYLAKNEQNIEKTKRLLETFSLNTQQIITEEDTEELYQHTKKFIDKKFFLQRQLNQNLRPFYKKITHSLKLLEERCYLFLQKGHVSDFLQSYNNFSKQLEIYTLFFGLKAPTTFHDDYSKTTINSLKSEFNNALYFKSKMRRYRNFFSTEEKESFFISFLRVHFTTKETFYLYYLNENLNIRPPFENNSYRQITSINNALLKIDKALHSKILKSSQDFKNSDSFYEKISNLIRINNENIVFVEHKGTTFSLENFIKKISKTQKIEELFN